MSRQTDYEEAYEAGKRDTLEELRDYANAHKHPDYATIRQGKVEMELLQMLDNVSAIAHTLLIELARKGGSFKADYDQRHKIIKDTRAYCDAVLRPRLVPKPHWHGSNPWATDVVYVPIERLAECAAGGLIGLVDGTTVPYDKAWILDHWKRYDKGGGLDAYILPSARDGEPAYHHSLGVRFGAQGYEYLSPHNANPELTQALLEEFQ